MEPGGADTECVREAAPCWSLAGDERLLRALQALHQRVTSRCAETSGRLEEMTRALSAAALALHNVNNQFASLSNAQFVERRVYDDDDAPGAPLAPPAVSQAPEAMAAELELQRLQHSLRVVGELHEAVTILRDSDSESDSDTDGERGHGERVVLRPRDPYASRPLPHVVGSRAWRTTWHAGLVVEHGDSDSSQSDDTRAERDARLERPRYSESGSEDGGREESAASSVESAPAPAPAAARAAPLSPAAVAAELARRLAADTGLQGAPPAERPPPSAAPRRLYTSREPALGRVFLDEPPPLDGLFDGDGDGEDSEQDIFAELRRDRGGARDTGGGLRGAGEELFGPEGRAEGGIFSDVVDVGRGEPAARAHPQRQTETGGARGSPPHDTRKPVGGRALFGGGAADSIGAAILQRSQGRRSARSASDDETPGPVEAPAERRRRDSRTEDMVETKREKDIFDHLFARSEKMNKKTLKNDDRDVRVTTKEESTVDLFGDNLFDDIDDIFTSNVVAKPVKVVGADGDRPLFGDDDDLFADIAVVNTNKGMDKNKDKNGKGGGIFDSDDELFSEKPVETVAQKVKETTKVAAVTEVAKVNVPKQTRGLFDDDDDDIFADKPTEKLNSQMIHKEVRKGSEVTKAKVSSSDVTKEAKIHTRSLFDDDDESDNIFADKIDKPSTRKAGTKVGEVTEAKESKVSDDSKGLFDDDDDEQLFSDKALSGLNSRTTRKHTSEADTRTSTVVTHSGPTKTSDTIFNDEIINEIPSKKSKPAKASESKLFNDSDEDLFSSNKVTKPAANSDKSDGGNKPDINRNVHAKVDKEADIPKDDENSFLNNNKNTIERKRTPIVSLDNEHDDIFSKSRTAKSKPVSHVNLFDDDNDRVFVKPANNDKTDDIFTNNDKIHASKIIKEPDTNKEINDNPPLAKNESISQHDTTSTDTTSNIQVESNSRDNYSDDTLEDNSMFTQLHEEKNRGQDIKTDTDNISINNHDILKSTSNDIVSVEDDGLFKSSNEPGKDKTFPEITDPKPNITPKPVLESNNNLNNIQNETLEPKKIDNISEEAENKKINVDNDSVKREVKPRNIIPEPDVTETETQHTLTENDLDIMREVDSNKDTPEDPETVPSRPDIFGDIFDDLPPEFEKPKERKKSKNINALFDDDSDDEALFFKKNDVILDEKPDDFAPAGNTDLFGIFHDEPPAIDVDFTQESNERDVFTNEREPTQRNSKQNVVTKHTDSEEDLFVTRHETEEIEKQPLPEPPKPQATDKPDGVTATQTETKTIGKLKPMSFSINVNTLLPGASPKKTQRTEQTDGQVATKSNEELHTDVSNEGEFESKMVKSVSFEGEPGSPVLDNNLSKQRAKIQVKRRPSTRRARREAAKRAGVEFGEDSTDNSSSIDDQPRGRGKDVHEPSKEVKKPSDSDTKVIDSQIHDGKTLRSNKKKDVEGKAMDGLARKSSASVMEDQIDISALTKESLADRNAEGASNDTKKQESSPKVSPSKDVKSKVVYILNDEDIFSNTIPQSIERTEPTEHAAPVKHKVLNIVDDEDDIFKSMTTAAEQRDQMKKEILEPTIDVGGVKTLGKAYTRRTTDKQEVVDTDDGDIFKDFANVEAKSKRRTPLAKQENNTIAAAAAAPADKLDKPKKSIFDDLSDEENALFNTKKTVVSKKHTIFNSDSEEELFASRRRREGDRDRDRDVKRVEVRGPLFGDDDEDLFVEAIGAVRGGAGGAGAPRTHPSATATATAVFEDPLSAARDGD